MSLIEITNLTRNFGKQVALNNVSINLEQGKHYAIKGASGSGKSTLLYLMGGLDKPDQGEIIINGVNIFSLSEERLAEFRNRFVGFVFQFHFLLPSMNCLSNILLPAKIGGHNEKEVLKLVSELAQQLGVTHCLKKYPYELSGGEQQRINIIRAVSLKPKLLLCDEPTGNLDSLNSQKVTSLLRDLADKFGSTLLVVTHDNNVAQKFSHTIEIKDGNLL